MWYINKQVNTQSRCKDLMLKEFSSLKINVKI